MPGSHVRLSEPRLKQQCGFNENCRVAMSYCANQDGSLKLVGQAFYVYQFDDEFSKYLLWITQLVVDANFRRRRIATTLCNMACGPRHLFAAGIVSSNPFAIRALENAFGQRVDPVIVNQYSTRILSKLTIPYLSSGQLNVKIESSNVCCTFDTCFHVDHSEVDLIMKQMSDWQLGDLGEGQEFIGLLVSQ